jgi:tetratricopeptide (TPR) repeat protein
MMYRLAVVCLFALELRAQISGDEFRAVVRGHLVTDGSSTYDAYTVSLYCPSSGRPAEQAHVDPLGDFQVPGIPGGDYQLTVLNREGAVLQQEFVHVGGSPIEIRLPKGRETQSQASVISLAQLAHKIPRRAQREYREACKARRRGDSNASLSHLLATVALDPAFAQARSDLAAQYIDLKRYPEAFVQLAEASRLDPASATITLNSAICLERVGDLERAEAAARRAVALNPLSSHAQFALGIILVERKKFTDETVQILIASGEAYPVARLTAAQILAASGRPLEARDQLRGYLKNCDGKDRRAVETWLARLNIAP